MRPTHAFSSRPRRRVLTGLALVASGVVAATAAAAPSTSQLQSQIGAAKQHEQALKGSISGENAKIDGYQGTIDDLTKQERAIEHTLALEQTQLAQTQHDLRASRVRLTSLRAQLVVDRRALAAQLVAQYRAPQQDLIDVVVEAKGFSDLIERVDEMKTLRQHNTDVTTSVQVARSAVAAETTRLARLERRRQEITNASIVQRDQVARLRIAVVARKAAAARKRSHDTSALHALESRRSQLQHTLSKIEAREAAEAATPTFGSSGASGPSGSVGSFVPHGGGAGFFPAPGTNYTVNQEPELAARLDRIGRALGLHLIGLSGYRTPEHSVEVGGFADDPHTRGQASDTPGIEGVPEATLEQYGLTRPFGGAAEADHIQLLGSI